ETRRQFPAGCGLRRGQRGGCGFLGVERFRAILATQRRCHAGNKKNVPGETHAPYTFAEQAGSFTFHPNSATFTSPRVCFVWIEPPPLQPCRIAVVRRSCRAH